MEAVKTYPGRLFNGRFIPDDVKIKMPNKGRATLYVFGDDTGSVKASKTSQGQDVSLLNFFAAIDAVENEPITDDDLKMLENSHVSFRKELDDNVRT